MFPNSFPKKVFYLAAAVILLSNEIESACNVCSEFGIACVNETSFNLCERNLPKTDKAYNCSENKQCSHTSAKCVAPKANVAPTCDLNYKSCGFCDGTKMFACTSRRFFLQCDGVTPTNVTGSCSSGLVCDSRGGELCKNDCNRPAQLECDREVPL